MLRHLRRGVLVLLISIVSLNSASGISASPPVCKFVVKHLEFTQATQVDPRTSAIPVKLVSRKATAVRMYIESDCPGELVMGWIRIPGTSYISSADDGELFTAPASVDDILREQESETINFTIGPQHAVGTITVEAQVTPCLSWSSCNPPSYWQGAFSNSVKFESREQPYFVGLSLEHEEDIGGATVIKEADWDLIRPGVGDALLWDVHPLPDIGGGGYEAIQNPPNELPVIREVLIELTSPGSSSIQFNPDRLLADVGDTIRWINSTPSEQVVVSRNGPIECFGSNDRRRIAFGGSFTLPPGATLDREYLEPGCAYYRSNTQPGVEGVIEVLPANREALNPVMHALNTGFGRQQLGLQLEAYRLQLRPAPDFLYGWLCCANDNPYKDPQNLVNGGSPPETKAGHGTTEIEFFQGTYAHETGHMFGFGHINSATEEVGWSVRDRAGLSGHIPLERVKGTDKRHVMSSDDAILRTSATTWTEPSIWEDILFETGGVGVYPESMYPVPGFGRIVPPLVNALLIRGVFPADQQLPGTLYPVVELENNIELSQSGSGDGQVRGLDSAGGLVFSKAFPLESGADSGFAIRVPDTGAIHSVQLLRAGVIQDAITRTNHAPSVTILSPSAGTELTGTIELQWSVDDADGDQVFVSAHYSHNNGDSWRPLLLDYGEGHARMGIDTTLLASGVGEIRIDATDGLNSTSSNVGNLTINSNRKPQVNITSPATGASYRESVVVSLVGNGQDPEDGWLDLATGHYISPSLNWFSDRDGYLGSGEAIDAANLSPGLHSLSLVATDHDGLSSSAAITVTILAAP